MHYFIYSTGDGNRVEVSEIAPCQLLDVPNEVLLAIFKHLPRREAIANISRVCKLFRDLMNCATMWKSFGSLDDFGCLEYNKQMFDSLLDHHGHHFQKLYFNGEFKSLFAQVSLDYVYRTLSSAFAFTFLSQNICGRLMNS